MLPTPATVPTMYFVGVTTAQSSIMKVFPRWAEVLEIDAVMRGIDVPIHAPAEEYRRVVKFLKDDPLSRGALVTTHKLDLLIAARDMFDFLDPHADLLSEVSSISKRGEKHDEKLCGHAKDPITSGLALEAFIPPNWWTQNRNADALLIGAGGSSLAISIYLLDKRHGANRPAKLVVTNRSQPRLDHMKAIHRQIAADIPIEYRYCPTFEQNDAVLASMPSCSLVVNATGLGKDAPGSPLTDTAIFPENALAWEFNYRGDLKFLHQALAQKSRRNLRVEDGWIYFIHGWSQVIAEVFDITLTPEIVTKLGRVASDLRPAR